MNRLTRTAIASGATLATLAGVTVTAHAGPPELDRYGVVNIEVIDDYCDVPDRPDLTVRREQYISGLSTVRSLAPDGLVYFSDQFRFTTVRTNVDNGESLTTEGLNNIRDQRVTDNGDGTLTVKGTIIDSDRSYDGSGNTVARVALRFEFELLLDHGGTPTDPSDDVFLDASMTKVVGHETEGDFCILVHDVLD